MNRQWIVEFPEYLNQPQGPCEYSTNGAPIKVIGEVPPVPFIEEAREFTKEEYDKLLELNKRPGYIRFVPSDPFATLEFRPGHAYIVLFDPACIEMEAIENYCLRERKDDIDATFIPSLDGHTPASIESIAAIEKWLIEVKGRIGDTTLEDIRAAERARGIARDPITNMPVCEKQR